MKFKDKPILVYVLLFLSFTGSGFLWFYSEGFAENIMVELIGAVLFLLIIDQLLLKSRRKRWNIVKDEIEYLLERTIHTFRDDMLIKLFNFKPEIDSQTEEQLENIETSIRRQKNNMLDKIDNMTEQEILSILESGFLQKEYSDYFQEQAEDLWRIINNKYAEDLNPEIVHNLLQLHLFIRDLHNSIRTYKKAEWNPAKGDYYRKKGGRNIVYNIHNIIRCLFALRKLGYSHINRFEEFDDEE
jgi:TM2 domain-containing membrane protein YozV